MKSFAEVIEQEEIENHGVWVPFGNAVNEQGRPENEIFVAAAGNPAFNKRRIALEKQYRKRNNLAANKDIPEEDGEILYRRAAYDTLAKGWRGPAFNYDAREFAELQAQLKAEFDKDIDVPPVLPNGGVGPLPFNEANMLWYMEHTKRFRRTVFANAGSDETFNKENLEALGKA